MNETIDKYKTGIIGLIFLLAGFGGGTLLTQEQIDNAYVCTSNEKLAICPGTVAHPEPLSPSGISCYFNNGERDTYSRCSGGVFMPLTEYAALKDVSVDEFLEGAINIPDPDPEPQPNQNDDRINPSGKRQICNPQGCVDIIR